MFSRRFIPPESFFASSSLPVLERRPLQAPRNRFLQLVSLQPVIPPKRSQILSAADPRINRQLLRHPSQRHPRLCRSRRLPRTPPRARCPGTTRPTMLRISVLLPAPFGPSNPRHSPALHRQAHIVHRRQIAKPLHQRVTSNGIAVSFICASTAHHFPVSELFSLLSAHRGEYSITQSTRCQEKSPKLNSLPE